VPKGFSVRLKTDPEGYVTKAVLSAPAYDIKIDIQRVDDEVTYSLKWGDFDAVMTVPITLVPMYEFQKDVFKEVFSKPYTSVYEILGYIDHVLFVKYEKADTLEAEQGETGEQTQIKVKADEEGVIEKATVSAPEYDIKIEVMRVDDEVTVSLKWGNFSITTSLPFLPELHSFLVEENFRTFHETPYQAVKETIAMLQLIIRIYRDEAKDLKETKEFTLH